MLPPRKGLLRRESVNYKYARTMAIPSVTPHSSHLILHLCLPYNGQTDRTVCRNLDCPSSLKVLDEVSRCEGRENPSQPQLRRKGSDDRGRIVAVLAHKVGQEGRLCLIST